MKIGLLVFFNLLLAYQIYLNLERKNSMPVSAAKGLPAAKEVQSRTGPEASVMDKASEISPEGVDQTLREDLAPQENASASDQGSAGFDANATPDPGSAYMPDPQDVGSLELGGKPDKGSLGFGGEGDLGSQHPPKTDLGSPGDAKKADEGSQLAPEDDLGSSSFPESFTTSDFGS